MLEDHLHTEIMTFLNMKLANRTPFGPSKKAIPKNEEKEEKEEKEIAFCISCVLFEYCKPDVTADDYACQNYIEL